MEQEMEMLGERFTLVRERISEIRQEHFGEPALETYFAATAAFLELIGENWDFVVSGAMEQADFATLQEKNHALYRDILPEHYDKSYCNPAYAVAVLGEEFGRVLSLLAYEMRSLIPFVYEKNLMEIVIRMELFAEIYAAFTYEWEEQKCLPSYESIRQILYWFFSDYADVAAESHVKRMVVPEENPLTQLLQNADITDVRYLFFTGEYVGDNEIETARFLNGLPREQIDRMADTYTEGYRMGFVLGNKDLSKKKTVDLYYTLGFERMMRRAVENFAKMGLQPVIRRTASSFLYNPSIYKNGFVGGSPNRQYEFDHKDDRALFLDKTFVQRKLEVNRTAFEKYKEEARGYAGPAVVETFGEASFDPVNKPECFKLSEEQQELWVEYRTFAGALQREYILEEERSFTIIAFPIPEIAPGNPDLYREIFEQIIRINTLDYQKYRQIQQKLIDVLDRSVFCEIKGRGSNRTDLKVNLYPLKNPEKETIFENCVADVNIPVGEVFTSPVLKGTEGILHVSKVFLDGLEYRNLTLTFADGMIQDYICDNFGKDEENRRFIRENILFHHKTLPLGEFAIGTNTTAYVAAQKYGMEAKLPILIAEKMGPHFAVGDTCYSHAEDIPVFNPDGKEIVARDNEISLLRKSDVKKAYFNCHTDITIPYDELGELTAVGADGSREILIQDGRFVLAGCEALNEAFEENAE